MRSSIARVTFRAASSLVTRNPTLHSTAAAGFVAGRTCSTSSAQSANDSVVKHSSVSTDSLKANPSNHNDELRSVSSSIPIDPSASANTNLTEASQVPQSSAVENLPQTIASDETSKTPIDSSSTVALNTVSDDGQISETDSISDTSSVSSPTESNVEADKNSQHGGPHADSRFITPGNTSEALISEIRGYLRRNQVRSALFHFISALKVENSPAVDKSVLKLVLPVLGRHGWAPTALETINYALEHDYNLEIGLYNCGLHAMARSGDYNTVHQVIKRMWTLPQDSRPNATSYNYLIGSYMYRGAVDLAFEVLHEMKNHMIYPTFATYHALISGCLRSNDPRRAYTTLNAVERQRFDIGAMTISQVLVSCADVDFTDEVLHLLPRLEEALPRYKNEVHRIAEKRQAYRIDTSGKTSKTTPEERAIIRGNPKPEIGAISAILHCAFRNCNTELATHGWNLLNKYYPDMEIPETLWYCVIGSFSGSGDFSKAFEILGAMRERGYNIRLKDLDVALIRPLSLEINKVDEQYYKLCDRMKANLKKEQNLSIDDANDDTNDDTQSEIKVSAEENIDSEDNVKSIDVESESSSTTLKEVLAERVTSDELNEQWKKMKPSTVGIEELNCIIAACSFAGDLDRAFQTYDEVESVFGLQKNIETYNALLEGCIQVKHVRGGLRIISEMEKIGMQLEKESLQLAVRLLTRASRAPECIDLVKKVRSEGGTVSLQTYLLLLRYYVRGNSMDNALEIYEMGLDDGHSAKSLRGRLDSEGFQRLSGALEGDADGNIQNVNEVSETGENHEGETSDDIGDPEAEVSIHVDNKEIDDEESTKKA